MSSIAPEAVSKSKGIGGASVARVRPDEPRLAKIESSLLDVVGPWTNTKYISAVDSHMVVMYTFASPNIAFLADLRHRMVGLTPQI